MQGLPHGGSNINTFQSSRYRHASLWGNTRQFLSNGIVSNNLECIYVYSGHHDPPSVIYVMTSAAKTFLVSLWGLKMIWTLSSLFIIIYAYNLYIIYKKTHPCRLNGRVDQLVWTVTVGSLSNRREGTLRVPSEQYQIIIRTLSEHPHHYRMTAILTSPTLFPA